MRGEGPYYLQYTEILSVKARNRHLNIKKNQPTESVFFEPPGRPVEARSWGELLTILLSALRRIQIDSELALKELLNESLTCATSLGEIRRELGGLLRSLAKQRKYWCEKLQLLTWKRCISV